MRMRHCAAAPSHGGENRIGATQEVGPGITGTHGQRPVEFEFDASSGDLPGVSRLAVFGRRHQFAGAKPRLATGVVHEHQRQQPANLGIVREQVGGCMSQRDARPLARRKGCSPR